MINTASAAGDLPRSTGHVAAHAQPGSTAEGAFLTSILGELYLYVQIHGNYLFSICSGGLEL